MKSNHFVLMESGLVYIGYVLGLILFLENLAKIVNGKGSYGIKLIMFSLLLWSVSLVSRKLIINTPTVLSKGQKYKLEFLYFLFCHTFVTLFATVLLKHVPITLNPVGYEYIKYQTYSQFLNYLTQNLIFFIIINGTFVFIFLMLLLFATRFLYKYMLYQTDSLTADATKQSLMKILTYGSMLTIAFIVLQIPFVANTYTLVSTKTNIFLKANFQWLADYVIGSPVFYYIYASFKGSKLAEEFSLYRKFV